MNIALYTVISKEYLWDILQTLQSFTRLPVHLLDDQGNYLRSFGERGQYCKMLLRTAFTEDRCGKVLLQAGKYAQMLGEAYIFTCHANLNHIAFPLVDRNVLLGSVIVGPFLMDTPDSTIVSALAENYPLSPDLLLRLYDELSDVQILPPERVNHLKKLLDYLLTPLMPVERISMRMAQERFVQQSKINEAVQDYKGQDTTSSQQIFYALERELLQRAKTGNVEATKEILNKLLGHVFFTEGGSLDIVRVRAMELATLLSRVAIDCGVKIDFAFTLNNQFLLKIIESKSIDDLCLLLQDLAEGFVADIFLPQEQFNHYVRDVIAYVAAHYNEKITLASAAEQLGISQSHLSRLFKESTGITFREHLCRIRVEESKYLLHATDYPLADIAIAVGFSDQSYYCKAFKRITGMSPGQFR